jgi:hypothetical protein
MRLNHLIMAIISGIGGVLALAITLLVDQPVSLGTLLGVVLLLNALVRLRMARS